MYFSFQAAGWYFLGACPKVRHHAELLGAVAIVITIFTACEKDERWEIKTYENTLQILGIVKKMDRNTKRE